MAEDGTLSGEPVAGLSADDIVPNLYEGGFKTWECSVDLAEYVCSNFDSQNESARKDLLVVEVRDCLELDFKGLFSVTLLHTESSLARSRYRSSEPDIPPQMAAPAMLTTGSVFEIAALLD